MSWYGGFRPYVPVARRQAQAVQYAARIAKKENRTLVPVKIEGRKIASSFWGQAWCDNLERYSDFANRLPRGRTYVRNGSVIDLGIERGKVKALVSGSEVYRVKIGIKTLAPAIWKRIKQDCAQSINSLFDLLQGRFDQGIMQRLSQREGGLFPQPKEIDMECSCPDYAGMCKHIAAVLYGVGARLDSSPELLFTLRDVDHQELVRQAVAAENLERALEAQDQGALGGADLSELFGIELEAGKSLPGEPQQNKRRKPAAKAAPAKRKRKPATARKSRAPAKRPARKLRSASAV